MKRKKRARRHPWIVPVLIFLAVAAGLFAGGILLDRQSQGEETKGDPTQRYQYEDTFEVDGVNYRRRRGLTTILVMGIDRESDARIVGYRNGGQADFLRLVVIDSVNGTVSQMQIDRDTMTPITILGIMGNKSGVRTAQIALAHGFGDGKAQSCELAREAVSNLLFNAPIDFYMAMNMDGISVLNDQLGGIEVTLEDDFSHLDPAMTQGTTLTLVGDQAELYVRSRMSVGVGTNEARMVRQQQYISKLASRLEERIRADQKFIGNLFDAMLPYLTTDMARGRLINEAWAARNYTRGETIIPQGVHQVGDNEYIEFIIDEEALKEQVIGLFYETVK